MAKHRRRYIKWCFKNCQKYIKGSKKTNNKMILFIIFPYRNLSFKWLLSTANAAAYPCTDVSIFNNQ
jgi:hypothetical protein